MKEFGCLLALASIALTYQAQAQTDVHQQKASSFWQVPQARRMQKEPQTDVGVLIGNRFLPKEQVNNMKGLIDSLIRDGSHMDVITDTIQLRKLVPSQRRLQQLIYFTEGK